MASSATKIVATKGQKIISLEMHKDRPSDDLLSSLLVGPSGNLRAPAAWVEKTLLIGFNEEMYRGFLEEMP